MLVNNIDDLITDNWLYSLSTVRNKINDYGDIYKLLAIRLDTENNLSGDYEQFKPYLKNILSSLVGYSVWDLLSREAELCREFYSSGIVCILLSNVYNIRDLNTSHDKYVNRWKSLNQFYSYIYNDEIEILNIEFMNELSWSDFVRYLSKY